MHFLHRVGPGEHEVFVTAFQGRPAEVFRTQVHLLERGAGGAVKHQHRPINAVEPFEKIHVCYPSIRIRVTHVS